ncbi:MAG: spore germination protein [Bacillota bacterium]|nr:spore germination protein [Bacillota bacterium]
MKFFRKAKKKAASKKDYNHESSNDFDSENSSNAYIKHILPTVEENLSFIGKTIGDAVDLVEDRHFIFGGKVKAGLAYIKVLADKDLLSRNVIEPLLENNKEVNKHPGEILPMIQTSIISASITYITDEMQQVIDAILLGDTALFLDNSGKALIIGSQKITKRPIEKPENEATVLGSQESFTDNIDTNISLILKRLPVRQLRMEAFTVGRLSRTAVRLVWLDGIINPKIVEDVKKRIESIDIDIVDGLGVLTELIEESPWSLFPKFKQTERPDMVSRFLSNGCFAIISNNSPFAVVAPFTLWDNFKTMDDYEERLTSSSYLRIVRYMAFLVSVLITPIYLSLVTYNHTVVPSTLAINIAAGREGVPFPTVLEVILMSFTMSIVREAGLRMPGSVGYFIGTLAAVLIGQSIVTAGYVSSALIIVIAVSTIAAFAISATTLVYTSRLLNYFLILLAGFFGIFGLINGSIFIFWHLLSLRTFGLPYLYPVVPFDLEQWKDTFIRAQFRNLKRRSRVLAPYNRVRKGK